CDKGEAGPGLLWLARSLESADKLPSADAADLERPARVNLAAWRREVTPLRAIFPHDERGVRIVTFSPDGRTIGTVGFDRRARLWDAATGEPLGPWFPQWPKGSTVALGPDCRTLVMEGSGDTASLWDLGTGKQIGPPLQHQRRIERAAVSPDGSTVVIGLDD